MVPLHYCLNFLSNLIVFFLFSQVFANALIRIGHYFIQSKCIEIILNYSCSKQMYDKIFVQKLLHNSLKVIGVSGFNEATLNSVINLLFLLFILE